MNDVVKLLRDVFLIIWKAVMQLILIILTIALIPNKNLVSVWLSLLVWILVFKLAQKELDPKDWLVTFAFTIGFTTLIYLLGFVKGFLGIMLFYAVITGIQIYRNWKLYDAVTLWGAKKVKGIKVGNFDLEKVMNEDDKNGIEIKGGISEEVGDGGGEKRNSEESVVVNEGNIVFQESLPKLSVNNKSARKRRRKAKRRNALQVVSSKVRKDDERIVEGDVL